MISVLLPVYNGKAYVREAIESVLAQDYEPFEFVIVDNASTDGTNLIIDEYRNNRRVRVIRNKETVPRLVNFRRAFDAAAPQSRWFKFIGDDDQLLPGCLNEMVRAGEKGERIGLVCSYYYNGEQLVKGAVPEGAEVMRGPAILKKMLLEPGARSTIFSPATVLIPEAVYRETGGFRTDLLHADAELFYRILNRYDLAYVHKPLTRVGYHSSSGQAQSTLSGDTFSEAYLIRYHHLELYDKVKLNWRQVEKIKNNLVNDSVGFMLACLARGRLKTALKHLGRIPLPALYLLPVSLAYFFLLALRKLFRSEPIRLLSGREK
ncbi:MAG: glycosyltransferase [Bacillota bacterium]|nr:glycosyltransferase [Bacillota bacterium]